MASSASNEAPDAADNVDANHRKDHPEPEFVDYCSLSVDQIRTMANGTDEDRRRPAVPLSTISSEDVLRVQEMGFLAEALCVLFLAFAVPNGIFTLPPTIALIGKFVVGNVGLAFSVAGMVLLPLAILPQAYVPATLQSYLAIQVCKYFSFRFIVEERPPQPPAPPPSSSARGKPNAGAGAGANETASETERETERSYRPSIYVAPPHGVFPYGNILSLLGFPALFGSTFRGLASSAALRPPIFKQVLRSIGVVDASRHVARNVLEERNESIGISTGGVAEIFFTNEADECILLRERIGLIKLAIRTGSNIVPCYLFGNTKLLNCWCGGEGLFGVRGVLEKISRRLGFALILIYGRFFLPVPFRTPILAVMGKPIRTVHLKGEDPTPEQIEAIQKQLLGEMERIFDAYKPLYGWDEKKLIIK